MELSKAKLVTVLLAGVGAASCIFLLAYLTDVSPMGALIMAPFGATMVIAYALPDSPLAQPRNILCGHLISAAIGLLLMTWFGVSSVTLAAGVGTAVMAMMLTNTVHPPAGANPLLVMLTSQHWSFLLTPVLLGAMVIIVFAFVYHRLVARRAYPQRWF